MVKELTRLNMKMKLKALTLVMAVSAVVLTGCQYPNGQPNNTASGALIGGAMGAIAGAAIGAPATVVRAR